MKKTIRTATLFAVLSMAAVSCEKETIVDSNFEAETEISMRMVTYTVDGVVAQATLLSDDAWYDFLEWMFALAEEGHRVSFRRGNAKEIRTTKEEVTFTTKNHDEAYAWANYMALHGYTVSVEFDKNTGVYTCIAIR